MRVLALDQSGARAQAALVVDERQVTGSEGDGALAEMAAGVLETSASESIDMIAVIVGPGRFTGIRAALSLAHGIGLAAGVPVIGVTTGEAIARALPDLGRRELWVATASRRGRVFIERNGDVESFPLEALPAPGGPIALAGDAAPVVSAILAARGADVMLTDARNANPAPIAALGAARRRGDMPPREAQPLYVDPPAVSAPGTPARPPPGA